MSEIEYVGKCLLVKEDRKKILAIGDLHLGYEEALQRTGVLVPRGLFGEVLKELEIVFEEVGKIEQVVLLGDVKHTFGRILRQESGDVVKLIDFLAQYAQEIVLIKGNHDAILGVIAEKRGIKVRESHIVGSVAFAHGDKDLGEIWREDIKTVIVGHAHPAVILREGAKEEKYKCFLEGEFKGKKWVIAPSFAEYSEGSDPRYLDLGLTWNFNLGKFRVKIVGEGLKVLDFGLLTKLPRK